MKTKKYIISSMCLLAMASMSAKVVTYPAPETDKVKLNDTFKIEVSQNGGEWLPVKAYNVKVDQVVVTKHKVTDTSMAYFDFDGDVDVRVISSVPVKSAQVRPLSYGIIPKVKGDTLEFKLKRPRLLSVEVNGDRFNNLQLFANPIDASAPANPKKWAKKKGNIYFGPGYHKLDSVLVIGSNKDVYVAGGAYIDGIIEITDASNTRLHGRGMIYPAGKMGLQVRNGRNIEVEGVFTTQCAVGGSDSVKINNVKVMSYYGWGDGLNVFASSNVHYDGVFARTSDDCTTIYATRKGYSGNAKNIVTENSVLWADVAHPINIGLHGNGEKQDTIENILYRNIDILDQMEPQLDCQGAIAIVTGDNNLVRDVTFEDIRIENIRKGKLIDMRIALIKKYCEIPGNNIENIVFKDITYDGDNAEVSQIIGFDEERRIKGVHFINLKINGELIHNDMPNKPKWYKTSDMARIFVGEHVDDVTFEITD